ncbi:globin domain-containing protein [Streptomyces sp. NBC_00879]|uniref:globin domain-containing protein n=1 Tax=Streptomyces sp. NBC_00879 TaxID=2975855 RepID=UPI003870A5B8|nr:globin domain-containing protein [Streptomyces sp. NBC_00879]
MNAAQRDVIADSFSAADRRADHLVLYFYAHLFRQHPELRALFPDDIHHQRDRFVLSLARIVRHRNNQELHAYLAALGNDHRKFGVTPEHYDAVGRSLIAALKLCCGSSWSAEAEAAWTAAYRSVAEVMIQAAGTADRLGEPRWRNARVLQHRRHGQDIAVITAVIDRHLPYVAGQYVAVQAPQAPQEWRPYSIARAPRGDDIIELHISRVAGGRVSNVLVSQVRVGDVLRLGTASGHMGLPPVPSRPITLIAAGSGWAPMKALTQELARRRHPLKTQLFITARSPQHFYDAAAVHSLARMHPPLRLTLLAPTRGTNRLHATQRLREALLHENEWSDRDVYLCGPPGFVTEVRETLIAGGAPPSRIFTDQQPAVTPDVRLNSGPEHVLLPPEPRWINPAERCCP